MLIGVIIYGVKFPTIYFSGVNIANYHYGDVAKSIALSS